MGGEVTIRSLPKTRNGRNFLGMALCAVLELKDLAHQGMHSLTCLTEQNHGSNSFLNRMHDFIPFPCENGVVKSDMLTSLKPISVLNQKPVYEQTERNRCKHNKREKQFKSNKM